MNARFIIDVNLPRRFHHWSTDAFEFAHDFGPTLPDAAIWDRALAKAAVIVTADADFQDRALIEKVCPKIIHFRFGNLRLREWHPLVTRIWPQTVMLIATHRMVIAHRDRIDALP